MNNSRYTNDDWSSDGKVASADVSGNWLPTNGGRPLGTKGEEKAQ
jgi:hypothetical protein